MLAAANLSIPTCGQLIQCIVDENIESKVGEGKIFLRFLSCSTITESCSSADGHVVHNFKDMFFQTFCYSAYQHFFCRSKSNMFNLPTLIEPYHGVQCDEGA